MRPILSLAFVCALGCDACRPRPDAAASATRVASVGPFETPESARYDAEQDVYFVSNVHGGGAAKDNNGYISRLRPDGAVDSLHWIAGGRSGVTLHAPKGMAIVGDTLWVTDVDTLRGFDRRTGRPLASVDLAAHGAVFLNDVAAAPDGSLYISDTGLRFDATNRPSHTGPDRVFRVAPGRRVSVVAEGDTLALPNGVTWDAANARLLLVSLNSRSVFAITPGRRPAVVGSGPGSYDGIEPLDSAAGRFLVSSQDSGVYVFDRGAMTRVIAGVPTPADIGLDTKRRRVLIPLLEGNRVEIWQLNGGTGDQGPGTREAPARRAPSR